MGTTQTDKRPAGSPGFSLIELLAVIAVVIALMGLAAVGARMIGRMAVRKRAAQQIRLLQEAVEAYRMKEAGHLPNVPALTSMADAGFAAYRNALASHVAGVSFIDPWGGPFYYQRTGKEKCLILSCGPDGQLHTGDDLTNESGGH